MIIVIHGENIKESRNYFFNAKNAAKNPLIFDGTTVTLTDLVQAIEGQGLFVDQSEIFIEELLSKRKPGKELESILSYLNQHHTSHKISLWESKQVTSIPRGEMEVKRFDLPKTLFAFLDALKPNNAQVIIQLFHKTLETEEPEFIFFMIVRQFRILLGLCETPKGEPIDEIKRLAPWQKTKLQKQVQLFGKEKLLELYNKLFIIEEGMKTGQLTMSLVQTIDFFLASI